MYVCICVCMYVCMYMCVCMCMFVYVYVCVFVSPYRKYFSVLRVPTVSSRHLINTYSIYRLIFGMLTECVLCGVGIDGFQA